MLNRPWLDRIRAELTVKGLPSDYADRLVSEWADHLADLHDDGDDSSRLGDPSRLIDSAVLLYRSGTFAGRRPVLGFIVMPVIALTIVAILFTILADWMIEGTSIVCGGPGHALVGIMSAGLIGAAGILFPIIVCISLRSIYRTSGRPLTWYLAGCASIAAVALFSVTSCEPLNGMKPAVVGFDLLPRFSPLQLVQCVMPLGVAGFTWLYRDRPTMVAMA